jgi:hypothetical protein
VTFARLTRGHTVALVAALALMLVMALDWYGTQAGDYARHVAGQSSPNGALTGESASAVKADAKTLADRAGENAWQASPFVDRLILFVLLAAVALALAAAWLRAADVGFKPPLTPSALAALFGIAGVLLLAGRIVQKPNAEPGAVVKLGAPLGLVCVGALTLGSRAAWRAERAGVGTPADAAAGPEPVFDREQA